MMTASFEAAAVTLVTLVTLSSFRAIQFPLLLGLYRNGVTSVTSVTEMSEDHPMTRRALEMMMDLAPPQLQQPMRAEATKLGLLPLTGGYLVDGSAVYNLEDISRSLGMSYEDAQRSVARFMQEREAAGLSSGLVDPANVHLKH